MKEGKCAFADEFQTLIKRSSSGLFRLQSEGIFGEDLRQCLHTGSMTAHILHCCHVCVSVNVSSMSVCFKCQFAGNKRAVDV